MVLEATSFSPSLGTQSPVFVGPEGVDHLIFVQRRQGRVGLDLVGCKSLNSDLNRQES